MWGGGGGEQGCWQTVAAMSQPPRLRSARCLQLKVVEVLLSAGPAAQGHMARARGRLCSSLAHVREACSQLPCHALLHCLSRRAACSGGVLSPWFSQPGQVLGHGQLTHR